MLLFLLAVVFLFFFFKQKTAYEMRISDWSSDVCSSDLRFLGRAGAFDAEPGLSQRPRLDAGAVRLSADRQRGHPGLADLGPIPRPVYLGGHRRHLRQRHRHRHDGMARPPSWHLASHTVTGTPPG